MRRCVILACKQPAAETFRREVTRGALPVATALYARSARAR
jgi:hypothetical protein